MSNSSDKSKDAGLGHSAAFIEAFDPVSAIDELHERSRAE